MMYNRAGGGPQRAPRSICMIACMLLARIHHCGLIQRNVKKQLCSLCLLLSVALVLGWSPLVPLRSDELAHW
jgi:hypothetical protein